MKLDADTIEALRKALAFAAEQKLPKLVDTDEVVHAWYAPKYTKEITDVFDASPTMYVAYPDGTVALLSRDEDAVREFRMLWELAR